MEHLPDSLDIHAHQPFPVRVVNDAELLPAALGLSHEIGLVAGTGSIAVNRTRGGRMLAAGGWGWIGDEGGAGLLRERRGPSHALEIGGDPERTWSDDCLPRWRSTARHHQQRDRALRDHHGFGGRHNGVRRPRNSGIAVGPRRNSRQGASSRR